MSSAALKLRTFTRPIVRVTPVFRNTIRMSSTNEYGQGKSHATGESAVPNKVQDAAPSALEEALPDSVHPTGGKADQSTSKTHALNDGEDSIVPKKIQEIVPESVERALPNAIHNTGDK
ncbi:hypothetical protein B5807_10527 [Epicoccum nigrum]|uniref:Uncharacterized protein n=1 Tax=Epicoccum nigrum TaxID=105696 RepID=A0A1Y2LLT8_EPING|nr:hypothetical protein G6514_005854 [Epicoccum nigrum]OSS44680.1 hypothetical protein B5807_10527 [Epicoccum nigrum]